MSIFDWIGIGVIYLVGVITGWSLRDHKAERDEWKNDPDETGNSDLTERRALLK